MRITAEHLHAGQAINCAGEHLNIVRAYQNGTKTELTVTAADQAERALHLDKSEKVEIVVRYS